MEITCKTNLIELFILQVAYQIMTTKKRKNYSQSISKAASTKYLQGRNHL